MQSFDDLLQDQSKSTSYNTTIHAASSVTETLVDPQTGELLHSYPENAGGSQAQLLSFATKSRSKFLPMVPLSISPDLCWGV